MKTTSWIEGKITCGLAAMTVLLIIIGLFYSLITNSWPSIVANGLSFITSTDWNPSKGLYGAGAFIIGTAITSVSALLLATAVAVLVALYLVEIAPYWLARPIGYMVELLAAIPSVVLGLWAIFVMEPFLRPFLNGLHHALGWLPFFSTEPQGPGMAPAILILVVMILPIITAISRDSLQQVPEALRQAAYGVGTTRWGAIVHVILPAAISGITGGVMLALGRAMGETMAVTMIIGNSTNFSWSLLAPGNTISSMLANQFGEADGLQVSALMYAALVLMLLTLVVNVLAQQVVRRLSLKY